MDPRRLYREIVEVEKQLRELLRSNPLNAQDANALRVRLVDRARMLAQQAPAFAAQRELEQVLWKPCFYKRIEDFRRRIRKYAAAPASDRSVRVHFARVSHEFQAFLSDAAAFYESLRAAYTTWLLAHRVSRIAGSTAVPSLTASGGGSGNGTGGSSSAQQETQANIDKCRTSLHRCLVFLGDLARYRELHSQKAKKNFAAAESFYHMALAVIPENGNPHNQLAVLATYVEAETVAVYRYCRSLLLAQPFATAEENLALLFERSRQRPLAPPATAMVSERSTAKDKSAYLKSFLHRLTRMHGVLFSLATSSSSASASSSSSSSASAAAPPVYSKEMESLLMKDLATLLATGNVGDALLLKLVVINVFCVVRAADSAASNDALRLAVRTVSVVMDFLVAEFPAVGATPNSGGGGGGGGGALPNALRLLGAVSTFCDFLRLNTKFLDALDAMLSRADADDDRDLCKRFAKALLESLVKLLNHSNVQAVIHGGEANAQNARAWSERQLQLRENVELRGFKPLWALVDAGAAHKWRDDLAVSAAAPHALTAPAVAPLTDAEAWKVRVWNVYRFAQFVCQDYEGNPMLYLYKGQFATSPSVVSGISNGFSLAPPTSSTMGLFNVAPTASVPAAVNGGGGSSAASNEEADDFDDEIIVYQPSPALGPSQPRGEGSSALLAGSSFSSPFGSDPFRLGSSASASPFANGSQLPPNPAQRLSLVSPSSVFGSFGSAAAGNTTDGGGGAIGSLLGYGGFHSLGSLGGGSSAFSGQGLLSTGWGNPATQAASTPSVTSLSGAFASQPSPSLSPQQQLPSSASSSRRGSFFDDMDDLAAIERESSLYQQKESSLSALFGTPTASTSSKTLSASPAAFTGIPPLATARSSSVGGPRTAPPPGFGVTASPPVPQDAPQFFTRNPFATP